MKQLFTIVLFLISVTVRSQTDNRIYIGTIDSIYSNTLKESRKILIHLPTTEPDEYLSNPKYPVVFVLDADFLPVVTIAEKLSAGLGNFSYPKMIVVAITNTDRTRDFTPTHSTDGTVMPGFLLETSGGGDNFNRFLESELAPYIDAHYPTAPFRVFIGHSFGGLAVINNLINQKSIFNAFIAIDPSMWWDQLKFLKQTQQAFQKNTFLNKSLYLAIANTMDRTFTLETVVKDTTPNTLPIRSILKLDKFIKKNNPAGLTYRSKYYWDYDHNGIPLIAQNDGLPFVFSFYGINFPFPDFFNPAFINDDTLINHYKKVSDRMGYKISPPGELINAIAHQLTDMKQFERAKKYYQLNISNYPGSYLPFYSMGEYYESIGDKMKALEFYKKALTLKDRKEIRTKIEGLQ